MELFNINGCLTNDGILMIIQEDLDDMQALEASEHLSFCNHCLLRYTNSIASIPEDQLLIPENSIGKHILLAIKKRMVTIFYHRYVTVTIATSFAILITCSGIFDTSWNVDNGKMTNYERHLLTKQQYQEIREHKTQVIDDILNLSFLKGE